MSLDWFLPNIPLPPSLEARVRMPSNGENIGMG